MTRIMRRRPRGEHDAGITLVELLIYSVLLAIVLAIVGSLLINGLRTHRDVRGRTEAVDTLQNAFSMIERSVRNSGGGYIAAGGNLLVVRERTASSAADADDFRCAGYFLDEADGVLRYVLDRTGTRTAAALDASDPATVTGSWPVLVPYAERLGADPAFGPADTALGTYSVVEIAVGARTGPDMSPLAFTSSATLRPQSGSSLVCWP